MGRSAVLLRIPVRRLDARVGTAEAVLTDELERHIAAAVAEGWRPWRARRPCSARQSRRPAADR